MRGHHPEAAGAVACDICRVEPVGDDTTAGPDARPYSRSGPETHSRRTVSRPQTAILDVHSLDYRRFMAEYVCNAL